MWQYNYTSSDELYHYGTKGMKWGVRKDRYDSMSGKDKKYTRERYKAIQKIGRTQVESSNTVYGQRLRNEKIAAVAGTIAGGPIMGLLARKIATSYYTKNGANNEALNAEVERVGKEYFNKYLRDDLRTRVYGKEKPQDDIQSDSQRTQQSTKSSVRRRH